MFTGIIEERGTIQNMNKVSDQSIELTVGSKKVIEDVNVGDSIAVNGICLTVTDYSETAFQVDVMPETIKSTSLKLLEVGSHVNLERSMPANGRFGGHFVSGHVDGTGEIIRKEKHENALYYDIRIPEALTALIVLKCSIAIDGISLTVFDVKASSLTLSLIPHTVSKTNLGEKNQGDLVNIECDLLAKYVQNLLTKQSQKEGIN
ncbi:riboflavin synthase [Lentibacillus sp. Marseille-P4043]|uniref:riboflavin synthase n=1 Tax=Lentibacillus sp. Marseille-P4043 TaxID=2040293 RepID=UPI000D0B108F|nr:riboflavin synthase [Lentibacillus sp. Marseille-P4043]